MTHFKVYLRAIFALIFLALIPALSFADCNSQGICTASAQSAFFTPSSNDQSIIYLGELFGSVPPVLAGTGSGLMGKLFGIFNTAVMSLGILFAGYTTFAGILNTAGEGEMLGKAWSSIWIPIRTVAGIALLIPTASGYCVVQIFMMWLLVQGIGAADTLTSGIIDYMESGQPVYVPGNTPNSNGNTKLITTWDTSPIKYVYQGLSCMQGLQRNYPSVNAAYVTPPSPTDYHGNPVSSTTDRIYYTFKANRYTSNTPNADGTYTPQEVTCGTLSFDNTAGDQAAMTAYVTQGLAAIMPSLNAAAYFMVNDPDYTLDANGNKVYKSETDIMSDTFNFVGSDFMNQVANTYNSYVIQANHAKANASPDAYLDSIRDYGWITIGNLYWNMAKSSDDSDVTTGPAFSTAQPKWETTNIDQTTTNITNDSTSSIYNINTEGNKTVSVYGNTYGGDFINDLINTRGSSNSGEFRTAEKTNYAMAANGMMSSMTLDVLKDMQEQLSRDTENPMISAQKLGHKILYNVEALMTAFVAAELVLTGVTVAGAMGLLPVWGSSGSSTIALIGLIIQSALLFTMPFVFILYGTLMTLGGILAVIIPFIPALVFFLAGIAWLVATVETIVAAPIVAIGLVHPDGQHQVLGKAEPAIMLMVNMFLRPSLMVMGMAAGVLLSFISVQFVNFGYSQVMASLLGVSSGDGNTINTWELASNKGITWVEATMFLTTYVGLILACVNKSFSVIDALPDTVMRWIQGGEGTRFGGGQEAMQKLQGSQESSGQKASGDTMSSGQEGGQATSKTMDKGEKTLSTAESLKQPEPKSTKAVEGK